MRKLARVKNNLFWRLLCCLKLTYWDSCPVRTCVSGTVSLSKRWLARTVVLYEEDFLWQLYCVRPIYQDSCPVRKGLSGIVVLCEAHRSGQLPCEKRTLSDSCTVWGSPIRTVALWENDFRDSCTVCEAHLDLWDEDFLRCIVWGSPIRTGALWKEDFLE